MQEAAAAGVADFPTSSILFDGEVFPFKENSLDLVVASLRYAMDIVGSVPVGTFGYCNMRQLINAYSITMGDLLTRFDWLWWNIANIEDRGTFGVGCVIGYW